jgi:hypothetical protein
MSFLVCGFLNSALSESWKIFDIKPGEGNLECLLFCRVGPLRQFQKGSVLETIQDENWGLLLLDLGKSLDLWTLSSGFPGGLSVLVDLQEHCSKHSHRELVLLDVDVKYLLKHETMNCLSIH